METINPKDIRIGNWIYFVDLITGVEDITPIQVTIDDLKDIATGNYEPAITEYRPIPITEQWLTDAGFTYWASTNVFVKDYGTNGGRVFIKWGKEYNAFCWKFGDCYQKVLDYVHNFQNGYRFHTGEELIFNREGQ